jgi:hypothetical protein
MNMKYKVLGTKVFIYLFKILEFSICLKTFLKFNFECVQML